MRLVDRLLLAAAAAGALGLASCSTSPKALSAPLGPHLNVTSASFKPGEAIPARFSGEGEDLSPQLAWKNVPAEAKELALIVDDPDAPGGEAFTHWLAWGIAPARAELAEGASKAEAGLKQGANDFGNTGYNGPMPPEGHGIHHYRFTVYALKSPLSLAAGASKADLLAAMKDQIAAQGTVTGTYERKKK